MASLGEEGGMVMPVAPMNNYGGGNGFGQDGWWIVLLIILLAAGNGFGNNAGNNGGGYLIQDGFNQAALSSGIAGVQSSITSGFSAVQQSLCNGFAQVEISNNARQMAEMQQNFALQQQFNNCCCENRAAIADLKYTVAQENCADRQAVNDAIITLGNQMNAGFQAIKDEFCADRLAQKDETIAQLRSQINELSRQASQNSQTAAIIANNEAQTVALENYLNPVARPAYIVPNPNCCGQNYGYGCNYGVV